MTKVFFAMEIHSGNQALVDDPNGEIIQVLHRLIRDQLEQIEEPIDTSVRDSNGNRIGWVELRYMEDEE